MTEKSILWSAPTSGDGAAAYTEAEATRMFRSLVGNDIAAEGVLYGVDNELAVSGASSPLSVATGAAFVQGYFYWSDAVVNVTVPTPTTGTTGHRVVLRWLAASKTVRVVLISSPDGTATLPTPTQTPGVQWEISIAGLTITTGGVITVQEQSDQFLHFATKVATGMIDDLAVTLAKLAADSVDDSKAGNRVPQFYRRQGGNASDWSVLGSTNYTPTAVRMQAGVVNVVLGSASITFPVAFSNPPVMFLTPKTTNPRFVAVSNVTASGATVLIYDQSGSSSVSDPVFWLAIGPE